MKTPEELAEEYATPKFEQYDETKGYQKAQKSAFLAGFKAGSQRTDAELLKAFLDIKEKDSLGPKLAAFINGMRRGLKQVRDYNENT